MVKDFRSYCFLNDPAPGGAWLWASPGRVIFNLMIKEPSFDDNEFPAKATLVNVNNALRALKVLIEEYNNTSVALPRLGEESGLLWADIEVLIEKYLKDLDATIILYETYEMGTRAKEFLGLNA